MDNDQIYITLFLLFILLFSVVGFIVMMKYLRRKCIEFLFQDDSDEAHIK